MDLDQARPAARLVWSQSTQRRGEPLGNGLLLGRLTSDELEDPALLLQIARLLGRLYLDQTGALRPPYFDLAR